MTNLTKLQDAYTQMRWLREDAAKGNKLEEGSFHLAMRYIHEFIVDNTPTPKGKFNIWDWTVNDSQRPVLEGVFHDKEHKVAVATNAYALVADSELYDESKADDGFMPKGCRMKWYRPVDKYGKLIDGRFPDWKAVVPKTDESYKMFKVSMDDLNNYIKKCKAYMKLNGLTGRYAKIPLYKVGDTLFNAEFLRTFLIATEGQIYINEKPIYPACTKGVYWGEKRTALIMPVLEGDGLYEEAKEEGLYLQYRY